MRTATGGLSLISALVLGGFLFLQPRMAPTGAHAQATALVEAQDRESRSSTAAATTPRSNVTSHSSTQGKAFQPPRCCGDAYSLVEEFFFGSSTQSEKSASRDVIRLAGEQHYDLDFLTAMVPDPIDSRSGWRYDLVVDSIQRALEANNYIQDRFCLPWKCISDRSDAVAAAARGASSGLTSIGRLPHEPRLGTVLFRKAVARPSRGRLLVLFLVGETPTYGIDKEAFEAALDGMYACSAWDKQVKLLSPFSSGAAQSLHLAIEHWCDKIARNGGSAPSRRLTNIPATSSLAGGAMAGVHFRIVSGSATNSWIKRILEPDDGAEGVVDFRATVVPDNIMLEEFENYLRKIDPVAKVALLKETNSEYGRSFSQADNASNRSDFGLVLPFPMNISQLRSAYEKQQQGSVKPSTSDALPDSSQTKLSVPLGEPENDGDVPPALSPGTTAPIVDLELQNLLSTISREGITYVGLLATDTRDKLFLARQIRKYCPDVRLFTFESDLLYTHPDFDSDLYGTIVVSSYPLIDKNQNWTPSSGAEPGVGRRLQFPMQPAEGVYNATLALLDYWPNGDPRLDDLGQPEGPGLLEYGSPLVDHKESVRTPSVWLTVVGRDDTCPLEVFPTEAADAYIFPDRRPVAHYRNLDPFEHAPFGFQWLLFWVLGLILVAGCLAFWAANIQSPDSNQTALVYLFRSSAESRSSQLRVSLFFAILTGLYGAMSAIFLIQPFLTLHWRVGSLRWDLAKILGSGAILSLLVATTMAALVKTILPGVKIAGRPRTPSGKWYTFPIRRWQAAALAAIAVVCVAVFFRVLSTSVLSRKMASTLLYYRATKFGDGLSPLAPLFLLGVGACAWCFYRMQHHRTPVKPAEEFPLSGDGSLHGAGIQSILKRIEEIIDEPLRGLPLPVALIAVLILFLIPFASLWVRFIPTFDGIAFYRTVFLLLGFLYFGLVFAFVQAVFLWLRFRPLLQRLARHPIAGAFNRLPSSSGHFIGQFWGRRSPVECLQVPAQRLVVLLQRYPERQADLKDLEQPSLDGVSSVSNAAGSGKTPHLADRLRETFIAIIDLMTDNSERPSSANASVAVGSTSAAPSIHSLESSAEAYLAAVAFRLTQVSKDEWAREIAPQTDNGQTAKAADASAAHTADHFAFRTRRNAERLALVEDVIAPQVATFLCKVMIRLRNLLSFVLIAAFLILFSVKSYPFEPQQLISIFMWAVILSVVLVSITILIQAERDDVLSRIAGTDPNQINLHSRFVTGIVTYAVLPLLGLLFTQIPQLQGVFSFVEPILRAFK